MCQSLVLVVFILLWAEVMGGDVNAVDNWQGMHGLEGMRPTIVKPRAGGTICSDTGTGVLESQGSVAEFPPEVLALTVEYIVDGELIHEKRIDLGADHARNISHQIEFQADHGTHLAELRVVVWLQMPRPIIAHMHWVSFGVFYGNQTAVVSHMAVYLRHDIYLSILLLQYTVAPNSMVPTIRSCIHLSISATIQTSISASIRHPYLHPYNIHICIYSWPYLHLFI
jgi:hypothetical protein